MKKKLIVAGLALVAFVAVLSGCIIVTGVDGSVYFEWDTAALAGSNTVVENTTDISSPQTLDQLVAYQMTKNTTYSYQYSYLVGNANTYSNTVTVDFYAKGTSGDLFTAGTNGGDVYFIVDIPTAIDAGNNALPAITIGSSKRGIGAAASVKLISTTVNGKTTTQVFDTGTARVTNVTTVK